MDLLIKINNYEPDILNKNILKYYIFLKLEKYPNLGKKILEEKDLNFINFLEFLIKLKNSKSYYDNKILEFPHIGFFTTYNLDNYNCPIDTHILYNHYYKYPPEHRDMYYDTAEKIITRYPYNNYNNNFQLINNPNPFYISELKIIECNNKFDSNSIENYISFRSNKSYYKQYYNENKYTEIEDIILKQGLTTQSDYMSNKNIFYKLKNIPIFII